MSAVRRSCQTMARCTAVPVARSHTTVVSRWLVMPIAAMSLAVTFGLLQRLAAGRDRRGPDVLRLVLDPARGRKMLREFGLRGGGDRDVAAKHDGARGCGALIDGQHKGHDVFLALLPGGVVGCGRGKRIGRWRSISRRSSPASLTRAALRGDGRLRAPRPACGERSEREALRRERELTAHPRIRLRASPSPRPSPREERGRGERRNYTDAVVTPPSTTMVCPVMKLEASEPR